MGAPRHWNVAAAHRAALRALSPGRFENSLRLELLREEYGITSMDTGPLEKEAGELMAIMTTMITRTKNKAGSL